MKAAPFEHRHRYGKRSPRVLIPLVLSSKRCSCRSIPVEQGAASMDKSWGGTTTAAFRLRTADSAEDRDWSSLSERRRSQTSYV